MTAPAPPACIDFEDDSAASPTMAGAASDASTPHYHHPTGTSRSNSNNGMSGAAASGLAEISATRAALVARTVHLRCLPTGMTQEAFGRIIHGCGAVRRVRICGNAATGQKWLYGFVEFAATAGTDNLMRLAGMELANGPDRAPLRLKCSRAKQPIVDVLPQDADPLQGVPCTLGTDDGRDDCINDIVLVISGKRASGGATDATGGSHGGGRGGQAAGLANRAGTANGGDPIADEESAVAGVDGCGADNNNSGYGCGCTDDPTVRCCSCCKCHGKKPAATSCCGGGGVGGTYVTTTAAAAASAFPSITSLLQAATTTPTTTPWPAALRSSYATPAPPQGADSGASLSTALHAMMAQGAFLDGAAVIDAARTALLKGMAEAAAAITGGSISSALSPSSLLVPPSATATASSAAASLASCVELLGKHAVLTGGPGSCTPGDPNAALPQRATRLALTAHLCLALLCLVRRSLADALPHLDAIVTVSNAIPQTPVVMVVLGEKTAVTGQYQSPQPPAEVWPQGAWHTKGTAGAAGSSLDYDPYRNHTDDMMQGVLNTIPLLDDDEEEDHDEDDNRTTGGYVGQTHLSLPTGKATTATASPSTFEGRHRDIHFHSVVLNTLLTVGLSLEDVQPSVAHSTFALVAEKARSILGMDSPVLSAFLQTVGSDSNSSPRMRLAECIPSLAALATKGSPPAAGDITVLPKRFFASLPDSEGVGAEGWWAAPTQPPMHLVNLFPC